MSKIPIALQLYSVRDDCKNDLPGVIKAVAKMGYVGVEFAGYYGFSADELRSMLDDSGLKCCGAHVGLESLQGDKLPETIEFHKTIGARFLIVPGVSASRQDQKGPWLEVVAAINEISDKLKPVNMLTGYHNHSSEFKPLATGELPWDLFFGNTRNEVIMQFDVGNALHGGADAAPFLKRYPGRALSVHVKEYSKTNDSALIGEGDVNWPEIFNICETTGGTQWYVVEQESYSCPPLECVDLCLKNLRKMGK